MKKTRTRIGSILLSLALILSLLPVTAMADETGEEPGTEDGTPTVQEEGPALLTLNGAGSKEEPYLVSTAEELIAALAAGGYIQLTDSFEVTTSDTTAVDKTVVLDLNGYTITWNTSAKNSFQVPSGGSLTVCDNSTDGDGELKIVNTSTSAGIGINISTGGVLTLESGTISADIAKVNSYVVFASGSFTMSGGTIALDGSATNGIYLSTNDAAPSSLENGTIEFRGSETNSKNGLYIYRTTTLSNMTVDGSHLDPAVSVTAVYNSCSNSTRTVTIESGTYKANKESGYAVRGSNNKTYIQGGTFNGVVQTFSGLISGGSFSVEPAAQYAVSGKVFQLDSTDNYYKLVDGSYVGRIGNVGYQSWDELFEAVPEGKNTTIYILSDANEITVPEGKNVTFYNSKKLSVGKLTNNGTCRVLTYPLSGTEVVNNGTFSLDHEVGSLINNADGVVNATANSPKVTGALINHGTMTISKGSYLGALTNGGTLTITGGTFQTDVKNLCAEGYTTQQNKEGTWDVMQDVTHVAEIDGYWYGTLQAAMSAAQNGDTVELLSNTTLNSEVKVSNKTLTLDMNGHTITYGASGNYFGAMSFMGASDITITGNGSFDFNADYMGDSSKSHGRIFDVENSAVLTIENGTFKAGLVCVRADNIAKVIIKGGSYYASKQYGDNVWWHLNLQDGSDAKFYVYGGTFANYDPSNSATESPEDNFCAEGYTVTSEAKEDGITYYTVVPDSAQSFAAKIGTLQYVSLDKAIDAAKNGDTITLLQKYEGDPVAISKAITIDLGSTDTQSSQFTAADGYAMAADGTAIRFVTSYTVTFDPTGGTVDPSSGATDAYGKLSELPTPTRENYRFNGWYTAENGGQAVTAETVFTVDTTIYAQWTYVPPTVDVSAVTLDPSELTLAIDGTAALKATVAPADATNKEVTWKSDNEAVATVDQSGNVTAVGLGEATITVTSAADPTKSAACKVTVTYADVTSVTLSDTTLELTKGDTATLTATVLPATADQTVTWSSSNEGVVTVDSSGEVTAVDKGTATITATAGDKEATCTVTVSYADVDSITLDPAEVTLAAGGTTELTAKVAPATADQTVAWTSSNPDVAAVDDGTVTGISEGTATITAAAAGGQTATCEVTVTAEGDVIVNVAGPDVKVELPGVTEDQAENISSAAQSVSADAAIAAAAKDEADNLSEDDQAALKEAAVNKGLDADGKAINLFTQAYLEITATGAEIDENGKITSITLDITPMVRVLASTAGSIKDLDDENSVVVQQAAELTVSGTANIQLTLPTDLAGLLAPFVKHVKDAEHTYYYEGTVTDGTLSFLNPHGFSAFTFPADSEVAAAIGNQGYATLKDAVNNASNKDTIILNQNNGEAITVQKNITFTLDKSGHNFTGTISAGAGYEMTTVTNEGKIAYTFTRISTGGSGSSDVSGDYIVNVSSVSGGKVTVNPGRADKGDEVTITAVPNDGYELSSLTVTDKDGDTVRVSSEGGNKYTFTMPGSAVTVKAVFVREGSAVVTPEVSFTDVAESFWAYNEIQWAAENGYMTGTTATTFNPNGTVTRQQVWMILARMAGANPANMAAAKTWAVESGISDGSNPGGAVTRQQLVALLYRFAGQNGYNVSAKADLSGYPDVASLASYAADAMAWSVANGIIGGTTAGTLNPTGTANRAQFAAILWRFYQTTAI